MAPLKPIGFWSYTSADDAASDGRLSRLRRQLANQIQQHVGREKVRLFQDVAAIPPGTEWEMQIEAAVAAASFFIPIITPGFLHSEWCAREVRRFREHMEARGRTDLIMPIHYLDVDAFDIVRRQECVDPEVFNYLRSLQWVDFRLLEPLDPGTAEVRVGLVRVATGIVQALYREIPAPPSPTQAAAAPPDPAPKAHPLAPAADARGTAAPAPADVTRGRKRGWVAAATVAVAILGLIVVLVDKPENPPAALTQPSMQQPAKAADIPERKPVTDDAKPASLPVTIDAANANGREAYARKDYAAAYRSFRQASDQGDAYAENYVGLLYANGLGVAQDYGEAMRWFRKAVDQGYAASENNIGGLYYHGWGVTQDYGEAMRLYRKAAGQGDADAQNNIGGLYSHGWGVAQDYGEAMRWYRKAADQGNADAQYNIGALYQNGWGVTRDYAEAMRWYRKAVDQGSAAALWNIARLYEDGLGVAKDPVQTRAWMQKAADAGHPDAKAWIAGH